MMTLTIENLKRYLTENKYPVELQNETGQLYSILKFQGVEYPLFLRVYDEGDLLQLLLFIPCTIKSGCEGDLARLLHLMNKEIDIPGFGIDEASNTIFYRMMIPAYKKQVEEELILLFLNSLELLSQMFTAPIVAVAQGKATYSAILNQLNAKKT